MEKKKNKNKAKTEMEEVKERTPNLKRIKKYFEKVGFHILDCDGNLESVFDFQADTIYSGMNHSVLIKVQTDNISRTVKEDIRGFKTKKGKEIWLIVYGKKKNDPGIEHIYRYEGSELIQESEDLSLKDALEKSVKSAKSAS